MNVHTLRGRGASSPLEVIESAKKADIDFVILTDEFPKNENLASVSGYYEKLLVMDEKELHFLDSRISFISSSAEVANLPSSQDLNSQHVIADLLSQSTSQTKSIMVLTHPFSNGVSTWTGEFPSGFDGIDIFNPRSISSKTWNFSKWSVAWSLLVYPFNMDYSFLRLFTEPVDETNLWNETLKKRKIFAFATADVTAKSIPFPGYLIQFPSYLKSFQIVSNHILLESELTGIFSKDRDKIYTALKTGRFYICLDLLGDSMGFRVYVQDSEKNYPMGSEIHLKNNLKFVVHLPHRPKDFFEIVLYRNGEKVFIGNDTELVYPIESKGVYRATVRISSQLPLPDGKRWLTWIYTNPFFIR